MVRIGEEFINYTEFPQDRQQQKIQRKKSTGRDSLPIDFEIFC